MPTYPCDLCKYVATRTSGLKLHKASKHNIGVIWCYCDQEGCEYKSKNLTHLTRHKSAKHNIGVKWYECIKCEFKTKRQDQLKEHILVKHTSNDNITWYECNSCDEKFKTHQILKRHKACIHDINVIWYNCDQEGCDVKTKSQSLLNDHKANIHDIGVTWYNCDQEGCEYKAKNNKSVQVHKAHTHDIGVTWYQCTECDSKFKSSSALNRHLANLHDIGKHECGYCVKNRNSSIEHEGSNICRDCYKKATGKTSRIEKIWSDYIDEKIGSEYLSGSDDSIKSLGGCQMYRPDKIYIGVNSVHLYECDENQHKYSNGDYTCDEKRISDIYDEEGICGKKMIVIRWNPHSYKTKKKQHTQQQRLDKMIETINMIKENPPDDQIHIYYLYYDKDNPRVAKNIPHTFITI